MLFSLKLNNRHCSKMLTLTSVQRCDNGKSGKDSASKHRHIQEPNAGESFSNLCPLLALLLALASAAPVLHAQEWDHLNGRDKVHDPTGAWLIRFQKDFLQREFSLIDFHKGGTLTENTQGENGFDPTSVNDPSSTNNVISSPASGVWQNTGWNTFAATLLVIEYHILTNPTNFGSPLFRFDKLQFTGRLSETGDQMEIGALLTFFDKDGNQLNSDGSPGTESISFKENGVRIPLEVLPNTAHTLPIPTIPTTPAP
jgi:hypothetical protein